jgi:hypothetical protein
MAVIDPTIPAASQLGYGELVEHLLNIRVEDVLAMARDLDPVAFSSFWSNALVYLRGITKAAEGDSQAVLEAKAQNEAKGLELWRELLGAINRTDAEVSENAKLIESRVLQTLESETSKIRDVDIIRIGTHNFGPDELRPDDIRVSEVYGVRQVTTIRSDVDVAFRTPRSITKIIVNMTFSGPKHINSKLRPLLAQLYIAPITTVESPLLANALVNAYASPEIEAEIKDRVLRGSQITNDILDDLTDEARSSYERLREILQTDDLVLEFLQAKIRHEERKNADMPTENVPPTVFSLDKLAQLGVQIPIAVTDVVIYTDPRAIDTLHVQLIAVRYASSAYGLTGLQFRDASGDPTPDINKCPWIDALANMSYLNPNKDKYYMSRYYPSDEVDFSCTWRDVNNRSGEGLHPDDPQKYDVAGVRTFPTEGTNEKYVVESVQAIISFGIATLPLLGSKYPAVQLMGAPSFQAKIVLATTSPKIVRQVHIMKDHLDAVARNIGAMGRDEEVVIKNAVLNTLGARNFIISSLETYPYPETSNAYRIEMDLAHARYNRADKLQSVVLEESGSIPVELFNSFLDYLFDLYQETLANPGREKTSEQKLALRLLFGNDPSSDEADGIVNHSTVIAAAIRASQGGAPDWWTKDGMQYIRGLRRNDGEGNWFEGDANNIWPMFSHPATARNKAGAERALNETITQGWNSADDGTDTYADWIGRLLFYPSQHHEANRNTPGIRLTRQGFDAIKELLLDIPPRSPKSLHEQDDDVWQTERILGAYQTIVSAFSSGGILVFAGFKGIDQYIDRKFKQHIGPQQFLSNYADMPLPTYRELLTVPSFLGVGIFGDETEPYIEQLYLKLAPTYSDLGLEPPITAAFRNDPSGETVESRVKAARQMDDVVEPGFFYYHDRVKGKLFQSYRTAVDPAFPTNTQKYVDIYQSGKDGIRVLQLDKDPDLLGAGTQLTLDTLLSDQLRQDSQDQAGLVQDIRRQRITDTVHVINNQGRLIAVLVPIDRVKGGRYKAIQIPAGRPIYYNAELGVNYDRFDAQRNNAIIEDSLSKIKDTMYWPLKHYPAFRLYFVEFDDNLGRDGVVRAVNATGIRLIDDLYTTNAVLSIHVTNSKDEPALAIVELLNTTGQFDQDEFITQDEAEARDLGQDDEGEDYLRRIRLQTGTGIVLKMGYSSKPQDLDTVFTGQIVEVEHGDIVRITCQGYKAELLQDVNYYNTSANTRVALEGILKKMKLPHLGRVYDIRDVTLEEFERQVGSSVARDSTGFLSRHGAIARLFGGTFSSVSRNIWWENQFDVRGFLENLGLGALEALGFRSDHEWLVHQTSGWDAIQEICRHNPGLVADVRPFNNEATLFVGFPDQIYQYRDANLEELFEYEKYISETLPIDVSTIAMRLISKFWGSKYGLKGNQDSFTNVYGNDVSDEDDLEPIFNALKNGRDIDQLVPSYGSALRLDGEDLRLFWLMGQYDWTNDLDYINRHPELGRFLFAYFFQFRQDGLFGDPRKNRSGGILDGVWRQYSREWFGPLVRPPMDDDEFDDFDDEDELIEHLTPSGKVLREVTVGDNATLTDGMVTVRRSLSDTLRAADLSSLDPLEAERLRRQAAELDRQQIDINENLDRALATGLTQDELEFLINLGGTTEIGAKSMFLAPTGNRVDRDGGKTIGYVIWQDIWKFRAFVHYLVRFMRDSGLTNEEQRDLTSALTRTSRYRTPPGYRAFRSHHMIWDRTDIIANNIYATMSQMANTVAVRAPKASLSTISAEDVDGSGNGQMLSPSQEWVFFPNSNGVPFLPNIDVTQRKLYVAEEPNANLRSSTANCLMSNLALAMRPMYRGDIKILGRHVNPWDIIHVYDNYNVMFGPIEVDRVTHEFGRDTGWVTTIEPHLYAIANNATDFFQTSIFEDILSAVSTTLDILTIFSIAVLIAMPAIAGTAAFLAAARAGAAAGTNVLRTQGARAALRLGARAAAKGTKGAIVGGARGLAKSGSWMFSRAALGMKFLTGLYIANNFAAPALMQLINNINIMAELNGRRMPVQIKPLVHKGIPMVAGLKLRDDQIYSFGELFAGAWGSVVKAISQTFSGRPDSGVQGIPTN